MSINNDHLDGLAEGVAVGRRQGIAEGINQGRAEGFNAGIEAGRREMEDEMIRSIYRRRGIDVDDTFLDIQVIWCAFAFPVGWLFTFILLGVIQKGLLAGLLIHGLYGVFTTLFYVVVTGFVLLLAREQKARSQQKKGRPKEDKPMSTKWWKVSFALGAVAAVATNFFLG
jgi:Flagellar biosynthesis/type III secretory pathway protein